MRQGEAKVSSAGFPRKSTQDSKSFPSPALPSKQWCEQRRAGEVIQSLPLALFTQSTATTAGEVCRIQEMFVFADSEYLLYLQL